jgi:hypothetical protein
MCLSGAGDCGWSATCTVRTFCTIGSAFTVSITAAIVRLVALWAACAVGAVCCTPTVRWARSGWTATRPDPTTVRPVVGGDTGCGVGPPKA